MEQHWVPCLNWRPAWAIIKKRFIFQQSKIFDYFKSSFISLFQESVNLNCEWIIYFIHICVNWCSVNNLMCCQLELGYVVFVLMFYCLSIETVFTDNRLWILCIISSLLVVGNATAKPCVWTDFFCCNIQHFIVLSKEDFEWQI